VACFDRLAFLRVAESREVERRASDAFQKRKMTQINGNEVAKEMCDGPVFAKYHDWAQFSCKKIYNEELNTVLGPLNGNHDIGERINILQHKQKVCVAINACTDTSTVLFNPPPPRSRCGACKSVVRDIENSLKLYHKPKRADVAAFIEHVCDDVALRHESPAFTEEVCLDMLDELQVREAEQRASCSANVAVTTSHWLLCMR
jgi:hypothetical protein